MIPPQKQPVLVRTYTLVLYVLAVVFGYGVFMIQDFMNTFGPDFARVARYVRDYQGAMAGICLVTALLRSLHSRASRVATTVTSVLLVLIIPAGTICFVYWLKSVRTAELPEPQRNE